ncbi:MAG: hemerythrin domain-containing protein [Burkholderiales bacterium]
MDGATPSSASGSPVDEFASCHEGVLAQLHTLRELPTLLEPAARARNISAKSLVFFREVILEHHGQEESELFPAVLASARAGEERDQVQAITKRLSQEHRAIETEWAALEPQLKRVAKGQDTTLDGGRLDDLVQRYMDHASYEEQVFLPLAKTVLGRNSDHMAALGLSLHLRHSTALKRFGARL